MSETALAISNDGRFSGYASIFNRQDAGGDIVMPGAFTRTLEKRRDRIRMLFQHDPRQPVGIWDDMREDDRGLLVAGRLAAGIPRVDAVRRMIEGGALDGLSIGFRTIKATRQDGARKLWRVDLFEISIVTSPMLPGARIRSSVVEASP